MPISLATVIVLHTVGASAQEIAFSGETAMEARLFPRAPLFSDQHGARLSPSVSLTPELVYEWGNGSWRLTAVGFVRVDAHDSRRTHADVREFGVLYLGNALAVFAGVGKVFWGVTEVHHLVDIVNQTDAVEDIDNEAKLGQPMVSATFEGPWGSLDVLYLPYFRQRTFPSGDARLRGPLPIVHEATFQSDARRWHRDFALRWSRPFGSFDVGASVFRGTSREPLLTPRHSANGSVLQPQYHVINQIGLDMQWTRNATLWKMEAITRGGHGNRFVATTIGVERTLYGLAGGSADLGLLAEFMYDGRGSDAPQTVFDNDVFIGVRWALNDVHDTSVLGGPVIDYETGELLAIVEAERRLGHSWRLAFEARMFANTKAGQVTNSLRHDGFMTIRVSRFL